MMLLRVAGIAAVAIAVYVVGASHVPVHEKLNLLDIVPGAVVTQGFGCTLLDLEPFDPVCPSRHKHTGIDLAAPTGTSVRAAAPGTAHVGFDPRGAGLYVVVIVDRHVRALYCHLSAALVANGEQVSTGSVIGQVGATGLSTGPHVHFEIQVDGRAVDPIAWLSS
jgi:murein DD-endopeptidase MepM/ murein hydrolase activator NlpD